ncbi:MAG: lamin tail domain-containing protein [Halobacteriota archaeon]
MISGKGKIRRALTFAVLFATMAFGCFGYLSTATIHAPIITEVYYDTYRKGDTDGEFIRIHNPTGSSINIGGWQLTDREGVITFPE